MEHKDTPNLEGLSVVTEQGMFGQLDLRDPNVRELSDKDKKKKDKNTKEN